MSSLVASGTTARVWRVACGVAQTVRRGPVPGAEPITGGDQTSGTKEVPARSPSGGASLLRPVCSEARVGDRLGNAQAGKDANARDPD